MRERCVLLLLLLGAAAPAMGRPAVTRQELPPLPAAVSGHYVGAHHGALIAAGGSSFDVSPFAGGVKAYHDTVWVLAPGAAAWVEAGRLPTARAYGAAVATPDGLLLIGGHDLARAFADIARVRWDGRAAHLDTDALPPLPAPWCLGGAGVVGGVLHVIGGLDAPDRPRAGARGWSLRLDAPEAGWTPMAAHDATARILPAALAHDNALWVLGGALPVADESGERIVTRRYLDDAWRLDASGAWTPVARMPTPLAAAPAAVVGGAHLVLFGGDDGALFDRNAALGDAHPGFPKAVWAYHGITGAWARWEGEAPGWVTTGTAPWQGGVAIVAGEDRPGHRTAEAGVFRAVSPPGHLGALDYAALAGYLAVVVGIGAWFARGERDTERFFLGGRRVPWWAVGISIFGTSLSAITYLSIPAQAYATDWTRFLANLGILVVAPFVVTFYLPRFHAHPIRTAYEYLERRFHLVVRIYGSLCFMAFQIVRVSIVLYLPAIALAAATGIDITLCILLMGVLATLYTVLGGIEAVIWTDVLQSVVLVSAALMALVIVLLRVDGGPSDLIAIAADSGKLRAFDWRWDHTAATVWVVLIGNAFSNLYPATADQTVVQRYLSTPDTRTAARAVWTNALLSLPVTLLFFSLGTALWLYFRQHPEVLDPALRNDAVLPLFIMAEFPAGLRGVVIAGIFAAAMSSLDSSINSVASVLVNDYYRRFVPRVDEAGALGAARLITLIFGAFGTLTALYIARLDRVSLWEPFLEFLGLIGGGISGVFALAMFTTRANTPGVLVGVVASALAVAYARTTDLHLFLYGMVGFLVAVAVGYAASLVFPARAPAAG